MCSIIDSFITRINFFYSFRGHFSTSAIQFQVLNSFNFMSVVREQTETGIIIDIPRQIQRYSYVVTLGSASSSVVVLVTDGQGHQFAAKVVSREGLVQEQRMEYFERELRLLEFIHHPNIVKLQEVVYLQNLIAVIMEYCEQGDLFDYLLHCGPLRPAAIRRFLYQILKALECLHEKGYAHRDLKPENIFVDKNGRVKVGDFGLAKASQGLSSTMCGTLYYTAPEVLEEHHYDARKADMWSIGILIYVMANRALPWVAADSASISAEIKRGLIRLPPDFPFELANLIQMCTALNPQDRPTPGDLLNTVWISEEQPTWIREFGTPGRGGAPPRPGGVKGSVARDSAKLILSRPAIRAFNSEKLRPSMSLAGVMLPDPN
jgi:serine/threonine protein kinase